MKSLSRGSIKAAAKSLRTNKGRSLLTMLGIIISVSSVITVAGIGQGVKNQVVGQINHTGKDLITVRPGQVQTSSLAGLKLFTTRPGGGSLSARDLTTVQRAHGVGQVSPLAIVGGGISSERGEYRAGQVVAASDDLAQIMNLSVAYGAYFNGDDDGQNVAVLGAHAADVMFDQNVPLGQTFMFRGQQFMVRGVLDNQASSPLSNDIDFNNAIFIPYTTARQLTDNTVAAYEIVAKPARVSQAPAAEANVRAGLLKLHGDTHDFTVLTQSDNLAITSSVLDLLAELTTGVAAISLLVGGVGIMNILLVSVTERMHEIGIRKAVGATNRQILSEFMAEALVLTVVGVVLGVVASVIINVLLRILTTLTPAFQWQVMLVAGGVSVAISLLFGTVPALKAARKDPIAALRNE